MYQLLRFRIRVNKISYSLGVMGETKDFLDLFPSLFPWKDSLGSAKPDVVEASNRTEGKQ